MTPDGLRRKGAIVDGQFVKTTDEGADLADVELEVGFEPSYKQAASRCRLVRVGSGGVLEFTVQVQFEAVLDLLGYQMMPAIRDIHALREDINAAGLARRPAVQKTHQTGIV